MNNIKATIKPKYTYPCTLKNSMQKICGRITAAAGGRGDTRYITAEIDTAEELTITPIQATAAIYSRSSGTVPITFTTTGSKLVDYSFKFIHLCPPCRYLRNSPPDNKLVTFYRNKVIAAAFKPDIIKVNSDIKPLSIGRRKLQHKAAFIRIIGKFFCYQHFPAEITWLDTKSHNITACICIRRPVLVAERNNRPECCSPRYYQFHLFFCTPATVLFIIMFNSFWSGFPTETLMLFCPAE